MEFTGDQIKASDIWKKFNDDLSKIKNDVLAKFPDKATAYGTEEEAFMTQTRAQLCNLQKCKL